MADEVNQEKPHIIMQYLNKLFGIVDTVVLLIVACGIVGIAIALLYEAITDSLFFWSTHTIPHIISELMFTLIIMELFRQVFRQINKHPFSLEPFLFIGFIASIRGLLLSQMGLAMGDLEWKRALIQVGVNVGVLFILVICYYLNAKAKRKYKE